MSRILAIDYGEVRTGIAVTDQLQIIASGLITVKNCSDVAFSSLKSKILLIPIVAKIDSEISYLNEKSTRVKSDS